jgi:uncharacterized protein YmfQ (DUF2313 family)
MGHSQLSITRRCTDRFVAKPAVFSSCLNKYNHTAQTVFISGIIRSSDHLLIFAAYNVQSILNRYAFNDQMKPLLVSYQYICLHTQ